MYDNIFVTDSTGSCHLENVVKITIFPFQCIYNDVYVERLMIFLIFVIWSIPFRFLDQLISMLMRYMYIWLQSLIPCLVVSFIFNKNITRHTTRTIVSWPNPTQRLIIHTCVLMITIRYSIYIFTIITREMGQLKANSPIYCKDNWENAKLPNWWWQDEICHFFSSIT